MHRYKPINGWTKEEIINAILQGNTGEVSTDNSGACFYRSVDSQGNTNRCAVGVFIPDDLYHEQPVDEESEISTSTVNDLLETYGGLEAFMPLPRSALIELQTIHDSGVFVMFTGMAERNDPRPALIAWVEKNVA